MTDTVISSGINSSGIIVSSGDTLTVQSGGIATSTTVLSGGSETVSPLGLTTGTYVSAGGALTIAAGGSGTNTTLSGAYFNGNVYILSAAVEDIYGTTTSDQLGNYSSAIVENGGSAISMTLSGAALYGTNVLVESGGSITSTNILAHASAVVASGAAASNTVVSSGGFLDVGGTIQYRTYSGTDGTFTVTSVSYTGGSSISTTVLSRGNESITSGGLATSTVVSSGGSQGVGLGGTAVGTILKGGTQSVNSGGTANGTIVSAGGGIQITSGGIVNSVTLYGGAVNMTAGTINNAILSGGFISAFANSATTPALLNSTTVLNGATEYLSAFATATDTVVSSGGKEYVSAGGSAISTTVYSGGTQTVYASGTVSGSILSGGTLVVSQASVTTSNTAAVKGLDVLSGGKIDLQYVIYNSSTDTVTFSSGNDGTESLVVTSGGTQLFSATLTGDYTGEYFHLTSDTLSYGGAFGTLIYEDTNPCYCPGTLIATDKGEVPVEELAIGDRVINHKGEARAIKWIGKRSFGGRFIHGRLDILPICFKAGALDENIPARDLFVSPHHAMYIDGVLIEAKDLVNGVSILRVEHADSVTYFHVELDSHDVILAEGAWAESFLDEDNRGMFHNAHEYAALYSDEESVLGRYYAPRLEDGFEIEAIRGKINRRVPVMTESCAA